jgi:hypothetical protein
MRFSVRWAVLATVALATQAFAQGAPPKISVAPVRGDKNNAVGSQLTGAMCKVYECVPYARVSTNRKPDWKKAKKAGVSGILTTTITKTRKGYTAGVALLMASSKPKHTWTLPLTTHRNLSGAQLKQVVHETAPSMGLAEDTGGVAAIASTESARNAPAPAPLASNTPSSPMSTEPPPASLTPADSMPILAPPPPPSGGERTLADTPVSADANSYSSGAGTRGQPLFTVELGGGYFNRFLSYTPDGTPALLTYKANSIFMGYVGLELFPFAKTGSFLAGLGLFANYQLSLGLKSQQPTTGVEDSSSFSMLSAGLEARIRPIKYSDFAFTIPVAFRMYKFSVDNASTDFPGLPQQNLLGVSIGLKLEIPIGSWFVILVGGDYVLWFQKQELIGNSNPTFFPSGSAGALELEAGVGFYIVGPLSLRLLALYSNTAYSFDADPTGTYTATSASDRIFGGRATVRLEF